MQASTQRDGGHPGVAQTEKREQFARLIRLEVTLRRAAMSESTAGPGHDGGSVAQSPTPPARHEAARPISDRGVGHRAFVSTVHPIGGVAAGRAGRPHRQWARMLTPPPTTSIESIATPTGWVSKTRRSQQLPEHQQDHLPRIPRLTGTTRRHDGPSRKVGQNHFRLPESCSSSTPPSAGRSRRR
jgi:hypothetical protein